MLAAWVAFPLLLGLLGYGCGALVERAAARTLPLSMRLPVGAALVIALLDLLTRSTATVGAAIPTVCVLAAIGIVLRPPWRWGPLDRCAIAPTLVYAIYAAPIVLSGAATWAGYVKLDDTATWLALVDRTLSAGHTLAGLPTSTYTDTLASYLTGGYPVGSFLPLGLGHALLGQDIGWLTDPWMAFMAAMLAFSLQRIAANALKAGVVGRAASAQTAHATAAVSHADSIEHAPGAPRSARERGLLAGAAAVLGASAALLYGYYLWGGMKEMAGAMLIAAFASTAPLAFARDNNSAQPDDNPDARAQARVRTISRLRAAIPALVVLWAILAALSTGGLVWILPGAAIAFVLLVLLSGVRLPSARTLVRAAVALALVCAAGAYLALRPGGFYERNKAVLTGGSELGNLIGPLHLRQIVGIWTAGDFRVAPDSSFATNALIVLAILAAAGALLTALRRDRRELALYVLCSLVGALIVFWVASPWLGGKALASASPAIAFAALIGCAMAFTRAGLASKTGAREAASDPVAHALHGRRKFFDRHPRALRVLAALAGLAIATGIVWSDVLGYHDVSLAPRTQFAELAHIGEQIAGQGPTLMTDYSPYGGRHFLREAEAESASELRTRPDLLISGQPLAKATTADIDQFALGELLVYRTLVLRRSPVASRPPSPYRLVLRDRYWDVWRRPVNINPPVLAHMPLGDAVTPGAAPVCSQVTKLARTPGATQLAAVAAGNPRIVSLGEASQPAAWSAQGEHLTLAGAGTATIEVNIPQAGRYAVWLGGSISGPVTVAVNGAKIGTARYQIQEDAQYVPFGSIGLEAGRYKLSVSYNGGDWRPGSGGAPATVGPLVLEREEPEHTPFTIPLTAARTLCGRTLDWIEALGR